MLFDIMRSVSKASAASCSKVGKFLSSFGWMRCLIQLNHVSLCWNQTVTVRGLGSWRLLVISLLTHTYMQF